MWVRASKGKDKRKWCFKKGGFDGVTEQEARIRIAKHRSSMIKGLFYRDFRKIFSPPGSRTPTAASARTTS